MVKRYELHRSQSFVIRAGGYLPRRYLVGTLGMSAATHFLIGLGLTAAEVTRSPVVSV